MNNGFRALDFVRMIVHIYSLALQIVRVCLRNNDFVVVMKYGT